MGGRGWGGSFDIVVDLDDNDNDNHYRDKADDDDGAFNDRSMRRDVDCFGVNFRLLGGKGVDPGAGGDNGGAQGDGVSPDRRGKNSAGLTSTN